MNRVLITGATGFIGSNLVRYFIKNEIDVHIIVRPSSNLTLISDIKDSLYIHTFGGTITELIDIVRLAAPEVVFHLAALFIAEHKTEDIKQLIESNILFGTQLLEATTKNNVKYFINTGTHWQHYTSEQYYPSDLYAATKKAFEDIARYYISAFDLRFITLKLIDTYGPFDPRPKVISILKKAAQSGEKLGMSGGEQEMGLLYIDDVIKAFLMASEYAYKSPSHTEKTFIASSKEIVTLKDLVRIYEEIIGRKLQIIFGEREYKKREVMKICCTDENILAKADTYGIYEGLQKMLQIEGIG
ncbi:NAD-dependent epimerase/dehydratase [Syntrophobotulus glycolicus DSM 8271]|uniref:NAD-dependent epimerase/dehydratase n=1 Tax=Syntrophobotulus glycolicus (strain DSM 8271 / FlGlyR) TaxID=645991 RepID=F0SX60_SYNGF|nr:NAD-dependent epimerase/dehydratase family protein [Syntrophobotulus glycolicus]ADY56920.1 NAD-dependent epimerase/dehydratase [Syntrophobotulus glycolicus DSM 8271]